MGSITANDAQYRIRRVVSGDEGRFYEHVTRHLAESGDGDVVFHPQTALASRDEREYVEELRTRWSTPMDQVGWEAAWVLESGDRFFGHLDLRSGRVASALHRAVLGVGLERHVRRRGFGRELMRSAIAWAREPGGLDWIDLCVFAHNRPARALYAALGFVEAGTVKDAFRVDGESIDDVQMCLDLRTHAVR